MKYLSRHIHILNVLFLNGNYGPTVSEIDDALDQSTVPDYLMASKEALISLAHLFQQDSE